MKSVLFLADGMADYALSELGGKTPLEYADTPNMDLLAKLGTNGRFRSLPDGFPTSSDVANMSVMGYDLAKYYPGRGPIEAVSQGIKLESQDIAWRCNLITVIDDILTDYSAGHIDNDISTVLMNDIQREFGSGDITFYPGVSYRNIAVLHGSKFTNRVIYSKPDSFQGIPVNELLIKPADSSAESKYTADFLNNLIACCSTYLNNHPLIQSKKTVGNYIWPHSPGYKPSFPSFEKLYGRKGAVISAVDVIFGIGICAGMEIVKVPGATGFIDTNYEGKARAAVEALNRNDFVYLHVEAIDECSHMGRLDLKLQAIEDFDSKIVGTVLNELGTGDDISYALLPDHPVPISLKKHTTEPVPVVIKSPFVKSDAVDSYSENKAADGTLGLLKNNELMNILFNIS